MTEYKYNIRIDFVDGRNHFSATATSYKNKKDFTDSIAELLRQKLVIVECDGVTVFLTRDKILSIKFSEIEEEENE
ncbi:hypothetical protein EP56_15105 [Listeriaceae bacterium FSL A5-0209]|nr:hypothetical protein EP56_15105 [Listeriaceae bacterium FSL A5-0209]